MNLRKKRLRDGSIYFIFAKIEAPPNAGRRVPTVYFVYLPPLRPLHVGVSHAFTKGLSFFARRKVRKG